jgi:hypothetical protein
MSRFALAPPKAITLAFLLAASSILSADALRAEEAAKEQLRKEIREKKGIDAAHWGEDIRNPFTNLTAEGKAKLKKQGVDVERLVKRKAVLLTGTYSGANRKTFVNRDPDTILVLGKDFITHGRVYSLGPVLAVENAAVMRRLTGADLVWFVEEAELSDWTRGAPLLVSSKAWQTVDADTQKALRHGDYGWRRPEDFLKSPALKAGAKPPPLAVSDAEKKKKNLQRLILSRRGEDVAACGEEVVNPFKGLTEKGRAKLATRGIDARRLRKLKAVLLTGDEGDNCREFVNRDADTILILGKDFVSHVAVFSLGPVLAVENAQFVGDVYGADLVWFVDQTFPRGRTAGLPVILASTANHSQMQAATDDIWYGDYGWKRPGHFLKLAPLTRRRLDALWAALDDDNASRSARAVRKLLAAEEYFMPYLKQRLRLPPRPTEERVGRLLDDLDSERYETRQAASHELERLGLLIEPELLLMLATNPTLEMRRRIEQILADVKAEQKRIRRAFQALEERDPLGSRQLLEELAEGDPDLFVTREAKMVLSRKGHQ